MEEPIKDPMSTEEAYRRGLRFIPLYAVNELVIVENSMPGLKDGPCELLFREQEMPPIDELDCRTGYCLGVATRYAGFGLDRKGVSPNDALVIFGKLAEDAATVMEAYRTGGGKPYSLDMFIDSLLRICGNLFADIAMREGIHTYVNHALQMQPQAGRAVLKTGIHYVHSEVEEACDSLMGNVPVYHIPTDIYQQCEISAWGAIRADDRDLFPHEAFMIAVDGETWVRLEDPTQEASSEWLIVDWRKRPARLYEKWDMRGLGIEPDAAYVLGAVCNPGTGDIRPYESSRYFGPVSGSYQPMTDSPFQANRLVRVALTFLIMLKNEDVKVEPHALKGHWNVAFPPGRTVDEIVDDILGDDQSA